MQERIEVLERRVGIFRALLIIVTVFFLCFAYAEKDDYQTAVQAYYECHKNLTKYEQYWGQLPETTQNHTMYDLGINLSNLGVET